MVVTDSVEYAGDMKTRGIANTKRRVGGGTMSSKYVQGGRKI